MFLGLALLGMACQSQKNKEEKNSETFQYVIDRFADIEIYVIKSTIGTNFRYNKRAYLLFK